MYYIINISNYNGYTVCRNIGYTHSECIIPDIRHKTRCVPWRMAFFRSRLILTALWKRSMLQPFFLHGLKHAYVLYYIENEYIEKIAHAPGFKDVRLFWKASDVTWLWKTWKTFRVVLRIIILNYIELPIEEQAGVYDRAPGEVASGEWNHPVDVLQWAEMGMAPLDKGLSPQVTGGRQTGFPEEIPLTPVWLLRILPT